MKLFNTRAEPAEAEMDTALIYLASLAPSSRATVSWSLRTCGLILFGHENVVGAPWGMLTRAHVNALKTTLSTRYAPHTVNQHLFHVRRMLRETWRLGKMDTTAYMSASDVPPLRHHLETCGRALSTSEIEALLAVATNDPRDIGRRDGALIATLYATGMRRFELSNLDVSDYSPFERKISIRHGKGNIARRSHPAQWACGAIDRWLLTRQPLTDPGTNALFPHARKNSTFDGRITGAGIALVCQRRAREAGVTIFSPHDLRRTAITHLLEAGVDLAIVQRFAGHAQVSTTVRYDRRGEDAVKAASALLKIGG